MSPDFIEAIERFKAEEAEQGAKRKRDAKAARKLLKRRHLGPMFTPHVAPQAQHSSPPVLRDVRPFAKLLLDQGKIKAVASPVGNCYLIEHGFRLEGLADWRVYVEKRLGWTLPNEQLDQLRAEILNLSAQVEHERRELAHRTAAIQAAGQGVPGALEHCQRNGWL